MTPIAFLIEHREQVLNAYDGSNGLQGETWKTLLPQIQVEQSMKENTFRTILKPFVETCRFFDGQLNKLNKTITGLNEKLNNEQELNTKLNNQVQELNNRLNTLDGLNAELNNELEKCRLNVSDAGLNNSDEKLNTDEPAKQKLNIAGWTVIKSGRYYRAFRKINKKVHGVHLGKSLDDAEIKIRAKQEQLSGGDPG